MSDTPENPFVKPDGQPVDASIVDTILDLDAILSADVRRAEKTARFSVKPWLEAEIDELDAALAALTDEHGNPLDTLEAGLGELSPAMQLAQQIEELRREYTASMQSVRVRQLPADKWTAFQAKWRDALDKQPPFPDEMWDELIAACAIAPAMTLDQVRQLRTRLGHPVMHTIALAAWNVCAHSGVSVPKSQLSSRVLKRQRRVTS